MVAPEICLLNDAEFKRLVGVRKDTFHVLVEVHRAACKSFGRPPALSHEDQVLLTLTYYREYRTYLSIAQSFGVSEATACRTVHRVEKHLIAHPLFQLPGKKTLRQESDDAVIVDVTESVRERPQKDRRNTTAARRNATR